MAVSLSQLAIWLGVAIAAIAWLAASSRSCGDCTFARPDRHHLALLLAGLRADRGSDEAIGAIMPDQQQGQQIAGLLNMMFFVPYFLAAILFTNPNGPLAVALTLFPTTAFTAITVRWGMTTIPTWQLAASWVILVVSTILCVVFAAQIFRVGMLTYGQRLDARSIRAALGGRGS